MGSGRTLEPTPRPPTDLFFMQHLKVTRLSLSLRIIRTPTLNAFQLPHRLRAVEKGMYV